MAWLNGKRTVYCRRCYKKGHNKRNCPELTPEQKAMYKDGDKARRCSYCGEPKHNKAGCQKRKADKAAYIIQNAEHRKSMLDDMISLGIGVGALISSVPKPDANEIYMVTEIEWANAQRHRIGNYMFKGVGIADSDYWDHFSMPNTRSWGNTYVISPVSADTIRAGVPSDWLNGTSGIDKFFE